TGSSVLAPRAASLSGVGLPLSSRNGEQPMARALWWTAPLKCELRTEVVPYARDGEVQVRTRWSAVSRGTERLVATGGVPTSEQQRMRAPFQDGDFPFPVKYGYAVVGVVERGPADLAARHVLVLYPHQSRFVVPASAALAIPDAVPASRAVLAPNAETAL